MFKITGTRFVIVPVGLIVPHDGRPLPSSTLLVWCWLYNHLNRDTGQCSPRLQTIADRAGLSLGSVKAAVRRLKALGFIDVKRRGPGSADYRLIFDQKEVQNFDQRSADNATSFGPIHYKNKNYELDNVINARGRVDSEALVLKEVQDFNPFTVDDLVQLYNERFLAKKTPGKTRRCNKRSQTYKQLKARIKERPSREQWEAIFDRMVASPWCMGRVPKCPAGMDLENVARASFVDKVEVGKYDARNSGVDLDNSWQEKSRLAEVMTLQRVNVRAMVERKFAAREDIRTWWPAWRRRVVIDLRADDAIQLEGRLVEYVKACWIQLKEGKNEQGTGDTGNARDVPTRGERQHAAQLPKGMRNIFE